MDKKLKFPSFRPYILDKIPNVYTPIDIKHEVKLYIENRRNPPTIIFDLNSIPIRVRNYYDNFCGGRHQCNQKLLISFFDSLKALNVKLFFVKKTKMDESSKWQNNMKSKLIVQSRIARDVRDEIDLESLVQKNGNVFELYSY